MASVFFLAEMRVRGWYVEGVEISQTGRDYAINKLGLPVYSKVLEELDLKSGTYDVVTLHYVIEHIIDPVNLLRSVRRILAPDGLVLIRWPHSTPIFRILGPFAKKLDLFHNPYHIYDFSPKTMSLLLQACGFGEIKTVAGGFTLPQPRITRLVSRLFGVLGQALCSMSRGHLILPGISKTTLAFKRECRQEFL